MPEFPLAPDSFDRLLTTMRELHRQKRSDYTGLTGDILHNYRQSSRLAGISMEQGMFARLCEKVIRLSSVFSKGGSTEVADEKVDDTLLDLAVISLLMIVAREERNTSGNEGPESMAVAPCGSQQCRDCQCAGDVQDTGPRIAFRDAVPQPPVSGDPWYYSSPTASGTFAT